MVQKGKPSRTTGPRNAGEVVENSLDLHRHPIPAALCGWICGRPGCFIPTHRFLNRPPTGAGGQYRLLPRRLSSSRSTRCLTTAPIIGSMQDSATGRGRCGANTSLPKLAYVIPTF